MQDRKNALKLSFEDFDYKNRVWQFLEKIPESEEEKARKAEKKREKEIRLKEMEAERIADLEMEKVEQK